tara:strand:- start:3875 stop:4618 length:744 start_codon:yes stop_codon:yes gene_type:complete
MEFLFILFILFVLVSWLSSSSNPTNSESHQDEEKPASHKPEEKRQHSDHAAANTSSSKFKHRKSSAKSSTFSCQHQEKSNEDLRKADPLKARGDGYELYIGRKFEQKGDLVIYNGFLRGYDDQGVDLVVISKRTKSITLVQCKNWQRYLFTVDHIISIYKKLTSYQADYFDIDHEAINHYLALKRPKPEINELINDSKNYITRKSLYLASDKVVNLQVGEHLQMMSENIFRYKDMKMVIQPLNINNM